MSYQTDARRQIDTVFSIANTLRGTYQPDKYRDVIIPMVILRRLECALTATKDDVCATYEKNASTPEAVLKQKSGYAFYNTSRYTLSKLLADAPNLKKNIKTYVNAFSPNIKEIFSDLDFEKNVDKMAKGSKLTGVVRKFSELDLNPEHVNNVAMDICSRRLSGGFPRMLRLATIIRRARLFALSPNSHSRRVART